MVVLGFWLCVLCRFEGFLCGGRIAGREFWVRVRGRCGFGGECEVLVCKACGESVKRERGSEWVCIYSECFVEVEVVWAFMSKEREREREIKEGERANEADEIHHLSGVPW